MIELTEEELEEIVCGIIDYKKDSGKDWDFISKRLTLLEYISPLQNLVENDAEAFKYYSPILIKEAQNRLAKENNVQGISVKHEHWFYVDHLKREYQWKEFVKKMSAWSKERLETVTKQSSDIVNHLADPSRLDTPAQESVRKGLVYGNVQSGKTAHIAALIAMYASSNCNMIIVLSGVTKNLRQQTQDRLRNDLGIDETGCYDLITANSDLLGREEQKIEGRLNSKKPCIGVFKKSPAALRRLIAYLKDANDSHLWDKRQVLIIDDECDQYSLNVKPMKDDETGEEIKRSTINGLLVKLKNLFPRYCYVGFTATPFANVLNECPGSDSFYPKDFIYPLKINERYYGALKLFGSAEANPDSENPVMDAINFVNEEEINPKINNFEELPQSLKDAVNYFIVTTACKYYRGLNGKKDHSSMLIHLDQKIAVHERLGKVLREYVVYILQNYKTESEVFRTIWQKEKDRISFETVKELFSYDDEDRNLFATPDFSQLTVYINEVLNKIEVVIDNSAQKAEDRLSYKSEESKVVIVIGGNTLSRGLTLEGLLVSVFYRTTSIADTLLQMGRWFGYREGYEDLPRLYTSHFIAEKYSQLADCEAQVREQFENYGFDITPEDVAVKIKTLQGIALTRKNAMQSAVSTGINFSGQRAQTLFFPRLDSTWLKHNIDVTRDFLDSINLQYRFFNNAYLFENIALNKVIDYVSALNIHQDNNSCNKSLLLKFMKRALEKHYLGIWNVAVVSNFEGKDFQISKKLKVKLIERSRYDTKIPNDERAYLKILQQPNNMLLDTEICSSTPDNTPIAQKFLLRHKYFEDRGIEEPGLLVIYPIDKDSKYHGKTHNRLDLQATEHIIGHMFVFPNNKKVEFDEYLTIKLDGDEEYAD